MDVSTINLAELEKVDVAKIPGNCHIGKFAGSACFGDPPGYPSYFLQSVYTSGGNDPRRGVPHQVIVHPNGTPYVIDDGQYDWDSRNELLAALWSPLPLEHPRAELWIRGTYAHHRTMYVDPAQPEDASWDKRTFSFNTVSGKAPYYLLLKYGVLPIPHISDRLRVHKDLAEEFLRRETAVHEEAVAKVNAMLAKICTPENHSATVLIRRHYPDFTPREDLIQKPPELVPHWWETEAEAPDFETCQPRSCGPHPVNDTWCQWCGWVKPKEEGDSA